MAEPQQAGYSLEPDPLPSDLSPSAPILRDIEKGYNTEEVRDSALTEEERVRKSSDARELEKRKKAKGKGLTKGDEGKSSSRTEEERR